MSDSDKFGPVAASGPRERIAAYHGNLILTLLQHRPPSERDELIQQAQHMGKIAGVSAALQAFEGELAADVDAATRQHYAAISEAYLTALAECGEDDDGGRANGGSFQ